MQFDSWSDFWQMGGYALYVWLSFGITFIVMLGVVLESITTHRKLLKAVKIEQARQSRITAARMAKP